MKIAIVHDYLIQMGGAERVVGVLHDMFPEAPILTTAVDSVRLFDSLRDAEIRTSWMQQVPGITTRYKQMLPLYPIAIRDLDLTGFDVVISSSSAFAKGIQIPKNTFHLCYCHNPMRFAWDFEHYMQGIDITYTMKTMLRAYTGYLKRWDRKSSTRVHRFVANSSVVKGRIQRYYNRDAQIIFPPVDTSRFTPASETEDYYLIVSRLVSYKRIDLAVEAFNKLGIPLYIVGEGPDSARLHSMANSNVKFLGRLNDKEVSSLMARCKALVMPGEEDFGITPIEANASGRPVIAFRAGGALDTIKPHINGLFFNRQKPDDLVASVREAEAFEWKPDKIAASAKRYDTSAFQAKLSNYLYKSILQYSNESGQGIIDLRYV
ncbi:glycosyltransferase [Paenibacillus sp. Soil522]|uniref:glycosyltransferase n=1 Tax=Paenibacillus sp. Soil522 TaxID=1736388 RepID=UPI0006FAB6E6|nr:glycosyltransferase [Paenibacillus sp. Soil522]KRE51271.1 glycosyl transferase [Paenibacillus sp. Soil522]